MTGRLDEGRSYREPAPEKPPEDFRESVRLVAEAEKIISEIRGLYLKSGEVGVLAGVYNIRGPVQEQVQLLSMLSLSVTHTRKYTRIEIPNCRFLHKSVIKILETYDCRIVNENYFQTRVTISIPKLGYAHETVYHPSLKEAAEC